MPKVEVPEDLLKLLTKTVVEMNIRTSRAEIITIRAAKAIAALEGRSRVTVEDLKKAMELVLKHRLRHKPLEKPSLPPPPPPPPPQQGGDRGEGGRAPRGGATPDRVAPHRHNSGVGEIGEVFYTPRHERSKTPEVPKGLRSRSSWRRSVGGGVGVPYMAVPGRGDDVDVAATLVNAVLKRARLPVKIEDDDIMIRVRRVRTPRIMLILLDTSGSMGVARRISAAKGLVYKLAEEAYVKRSYIALAAFRGGGVDYFHPPTRHYEKIVEVLSALPHGGSTPLSAALKFAIDFISRSKLKLRGDYWVYLITDGRANVPLYGDIKEEISSLASELTKYAKLIIYDARPPLFHLGISYMDLLVAHAYAVEKI
jgi:magnesium chelatase subunit D